MRNAIVMTLGLILIWCLLLFSVTGCARWDTLVDGQVAGPGHYAGYLPSVAGVRIKFTHEY